MAIAAFDFRGFRRSLQKAIQPVVHDLMERVRSDFINGRLVRCSSCGVPLPEEVCAVIGCSVCIFTVGRCMDCGGEEGAVRSIRAHFRAMCWTENRRKYGNSHHDAFVRLKRTTKEKTRYVRLVRA